MANLNYPDDLKYSKTDEWVRVEGDIGTVGITFHAQKELGDIVYVEVETVGKQLDAGAVFGTVEAVKTVSDLFMPIAGTITAVNPALDSQPELVNSDPYGEGWMVKATLADVADLDGLLSAESYQSLIGV